MANDQKSENKSKNLKLVTNHLPPKKLIGNVTIEERDEIKILFERKNGLIELAKSIDNESAFLYDKIVSDLGSVSVRFQKWWDEKSEKYKWENIKGYKWEINFDSCEIFLVKD